MNSFELKQHGLQSLLDKKHEDLRGGPFDVANPRSLINIAPADVVEILRREMPVNYLYMTEKELEAQFKPTADLQKVRIAFWKEYEAAQSALRKMNIANIGSYMGYGSMFIAKALRDVNHLAVILCPITSYDNFLEEALMAGARRLRELIDMKFTNDAGEPDHKAMELVLKAVAFLDMRKNGGIVQKTQHQISMTKTSQNNLTSGATMEEIDAKIRQLEAKNQLNFARETVGEQKAPVIEMDAIDIT